MNNPLAFRDPSGLACTVLNAIQQAANNAADSATFQRLLDQFAENDPQAARQLRDLLANANVSDSDLSRLRYKVVLDLNIALIGVSDKPPGGPAPPPPSINSGIYDDPSAYDKSHNFAGVVSKIFGGPPVPMGAVPRNR